MFVDPKSHLKGHCRKMIFLITIFNTGTYTNLSYFTTTEFVFSYTYYFLDFSTFYNT